MMGEGGGGRDGLHNGQREREDNGENIMWGTGRPVSSGAIIGEAQSVNCS